MQRLMFHPGEVAHWLEHGQSRGPLYTEMALSTRCNCRCVFCGVDYLVNKTHDDIETADAKRIIDELHGLGNRAVMFAGHGESLLHTDALEIISHASAKMSTSVTTNGYPLDDAKLPLIDGLKWIRFSINGCDAANYAAVHRVPEAAFDQVMTNLERAVERKRSRKLGVVIGVQLVLLDENAGELVDFARRLKAVGVDYFSVKPFSQHPLSECQLKPDYAAQAHLEDALEALQDESFKVIYRARSIDRVNSEKRYEKCHGTHFISFVSANGNVCECNVFDGDPRFLTGNAREESLGAIWRGPRRQAVLDFIDHDLDIAKECRDICRMDECNCYLDRLKNPMDHDDFI
ncbi:MAG: radical SAM protein [Verrucomicrobia bacterium]|nr:radical SAM protein [Verrucomicrobiota bacterium]